MNDFGLADGRTGVFLFEGHKIARASFLVPDNCRKVSTRAFLLFLEQQGLIESAAGIERKAILAGRHFSQIRFPPETKGATGFGGPRQYPARWLTPAQNRQNQRVAIGGGVKYALSRTGRLPQ
ncbi:MAG: hypothetical protein QOD67_2070 [Caballeronia sp.]|jgi:hypothetical protein|nr:hypothetical protein [Caballeronia sp.]